MKNVDNSLQRFFDASALMNATYDLNQEGSRWIPYSVIAEEIGVPVTVGSMVQIGLFVKKSNINLKRTSKLRLAWMPEPRVAKITLSE